MLAYKDVSGNRRRRNNSLRDVKENPCPKLKADAIEPLENTVGSRTKRHAGTGLRLCSPRARSNDRLCQAPGSLLMNQAGYFVCLLRVK